MVDAIDSDLTDREREVLRIAEHGRVRLRDVLQERERVRDTWFPSGTDTHRDEVIVPVMRDVLPKADVFWVNSDMVTLLEAAWPTMESQPLRYTDMPTTNGLVFFAAPTMFADYRLQGGYTGDSDWSCHAISWSLGQDRGGDSLLLTSYQRLQWEGRVAWIQLTYCPWAIGEETVSEDQALPHHIGLRQRLAAFWSLSATQKLAEQVLDRPPRAEARRDARSEHPLPGPIRIVRLREIRRPPSEEGASGLVDTRYTHRWVVSGHWCNQWYPSLGEASDPLAHRQLWRATHIAGPEDKPLVVKETVRAWTR